MSDPAPGSARAVVARNLAAEEEALAAALPPGPEPIQPVPVAGTVRDVSDAWSASTVTLDTNRPYVQVFPQDPQRARVTLIASSAKVYLCASRELAMEVGVNGSTTAGGALPASYPVALRSRGAGWAANATPGTSATVTVIVERYADPEP